MKTAHPRSDIIRRGVAAGVVGGAAEAVWISAVAVVSGISALDVARGISSSVGMANLSSSQEIVVGIAIHMMLAAALGIAVALACHLLASDVMRARWLYLIVPAALVGVWVVNFTILLPLINPEFVNLVPYPISFISKLLFGIAAAGVLAHSRRVGASGTSSRIKRHTPPKIETLR